jgi:hypothetical protein
MAMRAVGEISLALGARENLPGSLHILGWCLIVLSIVSAVNLMRALTRERARGKVLADAVKSASPYRLALSASLLVLGIPLALGLPSATCQIYVAVVVLIQAADILGPRVMARLRRTRSGGEGS